MKTLQGTRFLKDYLLRFNVEIQDLAFQGYKNSAKEIGLPVKRGPKKRHGYSLL